MKSASTGSQRRESGVGYKKNVVLFIPRRDSAKQIPKEVQLFLLMSYFGLGNVYWTFNLQAVFCLFETLKMFYPPKGLCIADTEEVQLFLLMSYFGYGKVDRTFNLLPVFFLCETLKMFYLMELNGMG